MASIQPTLLQALVLSAVALLIVFSDDHRMTSAAPVLSCATVNSNLSKCLPFLTGKVASAPAACCAGVKNLYNLTKRSKPNRVAACNCIAKTALSLPNLSPTRVASLPRSCGVNLGYSPATLINCSAIP